MAEKRGAGRDGYHHGDLRQAMIDAAEAVLAERGVGGFTLRECARRAGVSAAAPAHHFGNLAGLLTAVATLGFDGLSDAMDAAAARACAAGG
ncbi:helix-turn-helix domain-containing protein, partial [Bosea sp. (in: a-proteobacteria)]|uniref:TetR/AcrR family transcriptional regulator n=1 Tax=Bosea sp. (in: a-proteobacteria) TaxID=1871050 RepID=UPI0025B97DF7